MTTNAKPYQQWAEDFLPDDVKDVFRTALDIESGHHVRMQAAFQESVDAAISKTINFRNDASVEDVETAYMLAWKLACKGRSGTNESALRRHRALPAPFPSTELGAGGCGPGAMC